MRRNFLLTLASCFLLAGLITSCNNTFESSVELSFDRNIFDSSRSGDGGNPHYLIAITARGDGYDETRILGEENISQTVSFGGVNIGTELEINVMVFTLATDDEEPLSHYSTVFYEGHEMVNVSSGETKVGIKLRRSPAFSSYDEISELQCSDTDWNINFFRGGYYCIMHGSTQCAVGLYFGDLDRGGKIYVRETAYRKNTGGADFGETYCIVHNPQKRAVELNKTWSDERGIFLYSFTLGSQCGRTFNFNGPPEA